MRVACAIAAATIALSCAAPRPAPAHVRRHAASKPAPPKPPDCEVAARERWGVRWWDYPKHHWSEVVRAIADADRRCPQKMNDTELMRIRALMKLGRKGEARAVAEQALRLHGKPDLEHDIRHLLAAIVSPGGLREGAPVAWDTHNWPPNYGGAVDPAGQHMAVAYAYSVELEKLPTRFLVWQSPVKATSSLFFDASGRQLFVAERQDPRRVVVLDAATGARLRTFRLPGRPTRMAISKSVMAVVLGMQPAKSRVLLMDPRTGATKAELAGAHGPIALSHDGALVAAARDVGQGASVGLWRVSDATLVRHVDVPAPPGRREGVSALRFSPHDKWLAVGFSVAPRHAGPGADSHGIARIMQVAQGPLNMLGKSSAPVQRFRFDAAHDTVLVVPSGDSSLLRYDLHTRKRVGPKRTYSASGVADLCSFGVFDCRVASAVSADGLVLAFARKSVTRLLVRSPRVEVRELHPCGKDAVTDVALDAKGRLLAAACASGTVVVVATDGGALRLSVAASTDPVRYLALGGAGLAIARDSGIEVHALSGGVRRWPLRGAEALAVAPTSAEIAWGTPHGVFVVRGGHVRRVASSRRGVSAIAVSSSAVAWGDHRGRVLRCTLPCRKPAVVVHPTKGWPTERISAVCLDPAGKVVVSQGDNADQDVTRYALSDLTPRAIACPLEAAVVVDGSGRATIGGPDPLRITVDVASGGVAVLADYGNAAALNGAGRHLRCMGGEGGPLPRECCPPLLPPQILAPDGRWPAGTFYGW